MSKTILLNQSDWHFTKENPGIPTAVMGEAVALPHTWNAADGTDGGKSVLVTETPGHLGHLVAGFLRIGLRQFHVDAVGGHCLPRVTASPKSLHHEVH